MYKKEEKFDDEYGIAVDDSKMKIPESQSSIFFGNLNHNFKTETQFGTEWVFFSPDQLLPCFLISNKSNTKSKNLLIFKKKR